MIVIDTSKSMLTQDVKPNRLERTKLNFALFAWLLGKKKHEIKIEIEGVTLHKVRSVDGITINTDVNEYQDGDDLTLRKRSHTP